MNPPKLPPGWSWEQGNGYKLVVSPPRVRVYQLTPFPSIVYPNIKSACNSKGFTMTTTAGNLEPLPETITTMQEAVDYAYVLWRIES